MAPLPWVPSGEPPGVPADGLGSEAAYLGLTGEVEGRLRHRGLWRVVVAGTMVLAMALGAGSAAALLTRRAESSNQSQRPGLDSGSAPIIPGATGAQLQQVAAADLPEVVEIVAVGAQSEELGTGWPIDGQGDFITNDHVVHNGLSFHVQTAAGAEYPAQVINTDPSLDLAEVRVVGLRERPLPIDPQDPAVGEAVVVLASPEATDHPPVSESTVSGLGERATVDDPQEGETANYSDLIRIAAQIFPGNSGGPVLTASGQVVGILTLAAANGSGAFAIPLAEVNPILQRWMQ